MQAIQGTQQQQQPRPPPPQHPFECDFPQFPRDGGGGSGAGGGCGRSGGNGNGAGDHDGSAVPFANGDQVSVAESVSGLSGAMHAAAGVAVAMVDLSHGATVAQQPQVAVGASTESGGGGSGSTASVTGSNGTAANNNNVATMCQCILVLDPFPSQSVWR